MPRLRNPEKRGDLHIHVDVEVPRSLNERQRALLEQLASEMDVSVKEDTGGLLGKFKELFLG
jgi:molecular chaperone DnaJ